MQIIQNKLLNLNNLICIIQKKAVLVHREKCTKYKNVHLVKCKLNKQEFALDGAIFVVKRYRHVHDGREMVAETGDKHVM